MLAVTQFGEVMGALKDGAGEPIEGLGGAVLQISYASCRGVRVTLSDNVIVEISEDFGRKKKVVTSVPSVERGIDSCDGAGVVTENGGFRGRVPDAGGVGAGVVERNRWRVFDR